MAHPDGGRARGVALSAPCATVVLDTNAWLDLLVFDDPALRGVETLVAGGQLTVAIDARALAELERVLAYPALTLDPHAQRVHRDRVLRIAEAIEVPVLALPRCRDPDDQMFLEIAVAARARWLVTRDAELLRMASRMRRGYDVTILAPAPWRDAVADQMSNR